MKACEDYINNHEIKTISYLPPLETCKHGIRNGWRAALGWLRDNSDGHCYGDYDQVGDWSPCPKDVLIEEELNDESM